MAPLDIEPDLGRIGEEDRTGEHLIVILRLDGRHVGAVDPDQPAGIVGKPDGEGRRIENGRQALHLFAELAAVIGKLGAVSPFTGQRPKPQGGKAPGGAAIGLDQLAGLCPHADVERAPGLPHCGKRLGEGRSGLGLEPARKIEQHRDVLRHRDRAPHVAGNARRLRRPAAPDHQDVGLGGESRLRLVERDLELGDPPPRRASSRVSLRMTKMAQMKTAMANRMAAMASEASPATLPTAPTTPPMMPAVPLPTRLPRRSPEPCMAEIYRQTESCPLMRNESRDMAVEFSQQACRRPPSRDSAPMPLEVADHS